MVFDYERIEGKIDALSQAIEQVKALLPRRREITEATKAAHLHAIWMLGRRCPCCRQKDIVDEAGDKMPGTEFDHYYENGRKSVDDAWPLCKQCHDKISHGKAPRDQVEAMFRAYQRQRRDLPGSQGQLTL